MKSLVLALCVVLCSPGFASAAEKSGFGSVLWRYKVPNYDRETRYSLISSACYYNNRVYFFCDYGSRVYCLDALTGKKLWDFNFYVSAEQNCRDNGLKWDPRHHGEWIVPICMGNEIYIADDRLYLGAHDGMDDVAFSCLFCIDAITGKKIWRLPYKGTQALFTYGVSDGRVYFDNGCADVKTGRPIWFSGSVYASRIGQSAFALASGDGRKLVYTTKGGVSPLYIVSDTGHGVITRTVDAKAGYQAYYLSGNGRCYTSYSEGHPSTYFNCVDIQSGGIVWKYHLPGSTPGLIAGTPLYEDGRLVLCYARINDAGLPVYHVAVLDASGGNELWNKPVAEHPAMMGDLFLYRSKIYYYEKPFNLACLDLQTGRKLWSLPVGSAGDGTVTLFLRPAIHDGRAYIVDKVTDLKTLKLIRSDVICIDINDRR